MLDLSFRQFDNLQEAMKAYEGNVETTINDVLHNEAKGLLQEEIKRLMPVSGRQWKGKKPAAKGANSLTEVTGNLYIMVKSKKPYNYLYFPDDGSNTRRHAGNQQFFHRAGEAKKQEIIERCITRLAESL